MPLIDANGGLLHYELKGPAGAPVILFSNSLGTTHRMWDAQVAALAGPYRCLRYDTRGHGASPTRDSTATIDDLAEDIAALMRALDISHAHMVGLSLGGMTAQALAARRPELVDSLVLMATSAFMPGDWAARAESVIANGMSGAAKISLSRWFTPDFLDAQPGTVGALRGEFEALDPKGYAACCRVIDVMDLRESNAAIVAPTLIIAGAKDPATPVAMMEEIRGRIAGAELVVLSDAAHLLAVECADAVSRHLQAFLDAQPRQAAVDGGSAFECGLQNRRAVLGMAHVERSLASAGSFAMPWQDFITRTAWGEVWGDPALPWKTRSLLTLAMMVALNREEEFKLHLRPALANGVSLEELRALLLQTAIYAGVPAANGAFRWVKDGLGPELAAGGVHWSERSEEGDMTAPIFE